MEPKNRGLEDDVPFQFGDFQVPAVHFPGSKSWDFCGFTKSSDDLDLRQNRLTGQIPASLGKLEALKVPRFFGRLVLLQIY